MAGVCESDTKPLVSVEFDDLHSVINLKVQMKKADQGKNYEGRWMQIMTDETLKEVAVSYR